MHELSSENPMGLDRVRGRPRMVSAKEETIEEERQVTSRSLHVFRVKRSRGKGSALRRQAVVPGA